MQIGSLVRSSVRSVAALAALVWLSACAPEVGSERWCEVMRDKPRGDWTANDALEFARSCVLE
jgi:hypothetical protein